MLENRLGCCRNSQGGLSLFIDKKDDELRVHFFSFLDDFENEKTPDSSELRSLFAERLKILDARSCRSEIESLKDKIVYHEGYVEPTISVLNGLVALTRYCRFLLSGFEEDELDLRFGSQKKPTRGLLSQEIA